MDELSKDPCQEGTIPDRSPHLDAQLSETGRDLDRTIPERGSTHKISGDETGILKVIINSIGEGVIVADQKGKFKGSIGWYYTTVKLDLEARGIIIVDRTKSPQLMCLSKE